MRTAASTATAATKLAISMLIAPTTPTRAYSIPAMAGAMTPDAEPVTCRMALARSRWASGTSMAMEAWNAGRCRAANSAAPRVSA